MDIDSNGPIHSISLSDSSHITPCNILSSDVKLNRAQRKYLQRKKRQKQRKQLISEYRLSTSINDNNLSEKLSGEEDPHEGPKEEQSVKGLVTSETNPIFQTSEPNGGLLDPISNISTIDIDRDRGEGILDQSEPKTIATIDIEYVAPSVQDILADANDSEREEFFVIFEAFESHHHHHHELPAQSSLPEPVVEVGPPEQQMEVTQPNAPTKLSRRQRRLARRLSIATIKQLVFRPDLVEIHDTCSADPFLLVHLKSTRGTVSVPRHWSQKRKYLQGKRGIEKVPFQLPDFVRNTGIVSLRQAALERADKQKLKAKQRERLRPKMGQLDIDYHVLYEAFFRYQTKSNLTRHGELYYEGKEFELKNHDFVAGELSEELRRALGMSELTPPPWLTKMQRVGPPPSYPNIRVPGLNAPIPHGAQYGFHAGGWGSAPIDMYGRPIWGWVENQSHTEYQLQDGRQIPIDKNAVWGALRYEDLDDDMDGDIGEDIATNSPITVPIDELSLQERSSGLDTPFPADAMDLRKFKRESTTTNEAGSATNQIPLQPHQLFQVLSQQNAAVGNQMFGSQHTYAMPTHKKRVTEFIGNSTQAKISDLNVTLDPSDLELSEEQLAQKYQKLFLEHEREQIQPNTVALSQSEKNEFARKGLPKDKDKKKEFKF